MLLPILTGLVLIVVIALLLMQLAGAARTHTRLDEFTRQAAAQNDQVVDQGAEGLRVTAGDFVLGHAHPNDGGIELEWEMDDCHGGYGNSQPSGNSERGGYGAADLSHGPGHLVSDGMVAKLIDQPIIKSLSFRKKNTSIGIRIM